MIWTFNPKAEALKINFLSERYALEDKIIKYYPQRIYSFGKPH
jgi:hypothetical protein